ncbi:MAG: MauE/DoxX family redox-associated membrane protein [Daejeonella sp.]
MRIFLKISIISLSLILILAGLNHFRNPQMYLQIIPEYIPVPVALNYVSGIAELILGIGLLFNKTRILAAWGIFIMMIAFIPAHIFMIQKAPFYLGTLHVTKTIAWIRLALQPLLILWAYIHTKK